MKSWAGMTNKKRTSAVVPLQVETQPLSVLWREQCVVFATAFSTVHRLDWLSPLDLSQPAVFNFPSNQAGFSMNQGLQTGKVPSRFILLDSESTHCTFYTKGYLHDIRTSEDPILVHTNGGQMMCTLEGFLPGFRWVYYNPAGIANILSLAVVESRGRRITYDSC